MVDEHDTYSKSYSNSDKEDMYDPFLNILNHNNSDMKSEKKFKFDNRTIIPEQRRIIAIGDIHGDLKLALQCLVIAKVIPYCKDYFTNKKTSQDLYKNLNKIKWIGDDTHVVQVGDQVDRCRPLNNKYECHEENITKDDEPSDIIILDFFTFLHIQAVKSGGAVISLLGNHELMNINGDLTYVSKLGIDQFKNYNNNYNGVEGRKKFFERGGKYAQFLSQSRRSVVIIGSTMFAHAGIIKKFMDKLNKDKPINKKKDAIDILKNINKIVSEWIFNELVTSENISYIINSPESLFWNRILGGFSNNKENCDKYLNNVLDILGLDRMVIGHTPYIKDGITPACNNKLYRVDIGASKAFNNYNPDPKPQVLEIIKNNNKKEEINILSS